MLFIFLWAQMATKVVEVETIKKQKLTQTVRLIGSVKAKQCAQVSSKMTGILNKILVPCGSVKKGDVIAHLDNDLQQEKLKDLEKIEALEKDQFDRAQKLHSKKSVSSRELDQAEKDYLIAKERRYQARQEYESTQFIAPFDGVLGVFHLTEGMPITAGDALVSIHNPEHLFVRCDLPDTIADAVSVNTAAIIDQQTYKVGCIQKTIDPTSHLLPLTIHTPNLQKLIGTEVDVDVILAEKEAAMIIPESAIMIRGNQRFVYVIKDKKAHMQAVTLGIQEKDKIEVLSGLTPGDQVVKKGVTRLCEGIKVKYL